VRAHPLWLAALALAACAALAGSGCGGVGVSGASEATGNQLAIYSSLPLQGPAAKISQEIVDGERLALAQAGGRIGAFRVSYVSLDDTDPATGRLDPGVTAANAKMAAQDTSTIAYLGELGSSATAVSLPLINAAGILQVSPASPYVGLTSSEDAGQYEPQRFYPTGRRTFGRLVPGDAGQARALVKLMVALRVRRVYVLDDQNPFESPLAEILAADAAREGIAVAAHDSVPVSAGGVSGGELAKIAGSGAQALFYAGGSGPGAVALWRALHRADPDLLLLGSSAVLDESFTSGIGDAGARTYVTTPVLAASSYPPAAARVLSEYRRQFGSDPTAYALYGYEAMSVVLDAIRRAGSRGNERQAVIDSFFQTRDRDSVLGRYSMRADGESTLARYGVDRVQGGRAVFDRALAIG
jgi:branched-chain amino acid transport system substrate-binding protein